MIQIILPNTHGTIKIEDRMINQYIQVVLSLQGKAFINKVTVGRFNHRVKQGRLIKDDNPTDHFCSFFLPVHQPSKSIFLGHHIKANDWIPPGGHIDRGEKPIDTVYREYVEELSFRLTDEKVELFDLTIKPIVNNPRHNCQLHYDFWYLVYMKNKVDFNFTKSEFYDARWMKISDAQKLIKLSDYRDIILKVAALLIYSNGMILF